MNKNTLLRVHSVIKVVSIVFISVMMLSVVILPSAAALSIFDWDVNSWPSGSLTQTYTGIGSPATDITFTFSGDTGRLIASSPVTNQTITGGTSPPENTLFFAVDYINSSESITLTVNLSSTATSVSFTVMDIDAIPEGIDEIIVVGADQGALVTPTLTAVNSMCVSVSGNLATGLCSVDNTLDDGNVSVEFNSGIDTIYVILQEGSSVSDPLGHGIALHDINFNPNVGPVADAGADQTVVDSDNSGAEDVTLDGSGSSDSDGTIVSYVWSESSLQIGTGISPTISFDVGTYTVTLEVTDDDGATDTDDVIITVEEAPNVAPVADAGADQTVVDTDNSGAEDVTLDGSGSSDSDGTIVSYVWSESSLQIGTGISPTISFDVGTYTVTLEVTDDDGATDTDDVIITVEEAPNVGPVADAGADQTVVDSDNSGAEDVTLDGSGSSDSDGTIVSYVWSESSLQIGTGISPTISFDVGTYTVTLEVTDDDGATDTDDVIITVEEAPNVGPIVDAGEDQTVVDTDNSGAEDVTLDGSGSSDSDGTIVSYVWSESGLQIGTGISPTISFDVGTYTVTLEVTDDDGATDTDSAVIIVGVGKRYLYLPFVNNNFEEIIP